MTGKVTEELDGEPLGGAVAPVALAAADPWGARDVLPQERLFALTDQQVRLVSYVATEGDLDLVDHGDSRCSSTGLSGA